jgi:hypothetical protein
MNTEPNAFPSILIRGMGWVSFVLSSDSTGFVSYAGSLGSVPSSQILDCKGARKGSCCCWSMVTGLDLFQVPKFVYCKAS